MGKLRGFLEYDRIDEANIAVEDRVKNYKEFTVHPGEEKLQDQKELGVWIVGFHFAIVAVHLAI